MIEEKVMAGKHKGTYDVPDYTFENKYGYEEWRSEQQAIRKKFLERYKKRERKNK